MFIGVFAIIIKGDLSLLISLKFTIGDLWMLASAIGWALYSIYLFYWKTKLKIFDRFTLIAFFGAVSLFPFYLIEEALFVRTVLIQTFLLGIICSYFTRYYSFYSYIQWLKKSLEHQLTGFTFIFLQFIVHLWLFIF